MGSYATNTSMPQLLSQFYKDNDIAFDSGGATMASKAITRAEGTVNAALATRYSLPFTTVPPEVRRISEDIACYYIIRASHWQTSGGTKNAYLEDFKSAFEDLKSIAKGEMGLALTNGSLVPVNTSAMFKSTTEDYEQIFNLDDTTAWAVNPDQLDAISDDRE